MKTEQTNYDACMDACAKAIIACRTCANADLHEDHHLSMLVRCIKLDLDCSAICSLALQSMASNSEFAKQVCALCATVCNSCAEECRKHEKMEHCVACAKACSACASECERICM